MNASKCCDSRTYCELPTLTKETKKYHNICWFFLTLQSIKCQTPAWHVACLHPLLFGLELLQVFQLLQNLTSKPVSPARVTWYTKGTNEETKTQHTSTYINIHQRTTCQEHNFQKFSTALKNHSHGMSWKKILGSLPGEGTLNVA